jgi:retron-type reverse transcriptase
MNGREKSDLLIVLRNPLNKGGDDKPHTETGEGRSGLVENTKRNSMCRTQSRISMLPGLLRVRKAAMEGKSTRFTALMHHLTEEALRRSYYALRRQAAPGVDGCVWADYQEGLTERLKELHTKVHNGAYRALPSRRVYIPKTDGTNRPLGIAALEDKIVQHTVSDVLSAIYEEDFYGFSYGFRPNRGCHGALDALHVAIEGRKIIWVLDADIQGFFDTISHEWILRFAADGEKRNQKLLHFLVLGTYVA